jgi:hypothetical protein
MRKIRSIVIWLGDNCSIVLVEICSDVKGLETATAEFRVLLSDFEKPYARELVSCSDRSDLHPVVYLKT